MKQFNFEYYKGHLTLYPYGLSIDLLKRWKEIRGTKSFKKEPFYKSLKLNKKKFIIDGTGGPLGDSLLMLHYGAKVLAFENSPYVWPLIQDAIYRVYKEKGELFNIFRKNFSVMMVDAATSQVFADIIYLDPMYCRKNKARPKKEMEILSKIIPETSNDSLIKWAFTNAKERVVIKRALKAPPLIKDPTASYFGRSTRYDMYKIF